MAEVVLPNQITIPPLGGRYTGVFGEEVVRFADNAYTEYSSVNCFNADSSKVLLIVGEDHFELFDVNNPGSTGVRLLGISASSEPRWGADPNIFYFHDADGPKSNELREYNIATGIVRVLHAFSTKITFGSGEGDRSKDNFLPLVKGREVISLFDLTKQTDGESYSPNGMPFDSVYAVGKFAVVAWNTKGSKAYTGISLHDQDMRLISLLTTANGHHCVCLEDGSPTLVWTNSDEDSLTVPWCKNGVVKVNSVGQQTGLLTLGWAQPPEYSSSVHIAPTDLGWVVVETYSNSKVVLGSPQWLPYTNELLQVFLDGRPTVRLAHHRSIINAYTDETRPVVSPNGEWLIWTSNMSGQIGAYLMRIGPPAVVSKASAKAISIEERLADMDNRIKVLERRKG